MAERTAGIKLTLNASGFARGLRDQEGEAGKSGGKIGQALKKGLDSGIQGAISSVKSAFGTIKSTIMSIAGIGGGIGIVELARGAQMSEREFKRLAFAIRGGTGELASWRDMQVQAQSVALATAQSSEKLGEVMRETFQETGSAEFMKQSIASIATTATATREPVETLGRVASQIQKQFGVAGDQIGDALAVAFSASEKGGITLDEMSERLGVIGANAKEAGLTGMKGFEQMIALMNLSKDAMGNLRKGIPAIGGLLDTLGTKAERNKAYMKLGLDPSKAPADITKQIEEILKKTGGNRDKLAVAFQGPQLQFLAELGKTYSETFSSTSGDVKTKTAAAVAAYEAALTKAGKSSLSYADLQAEAAAAMEGGPAKFEVAMEKLRQAFARPEITEALTKLMSSLPGLADLIAKVVGFAVEHPVAAGAIAVGGIAGQGFLQQGISTAIGAAFARGGVAAAGSIAGSLATGGAGAASGMLGAIASFGPYALAIGGAALLAYEAAQLYKEHEEKVAAENLADLDAKAKASGNEDAQKGGLKNAEGQYEYYSRDKNGNFVANKSDTMRATAGGLMGLSQLAAGGELGEDQDPIGMRAYLSQTKSGMPSAQAPQRSKADAELLQQMLGVFRGKLRVEVTNPEAISGALGAPGGAPPAPGHVPRP